MSKPYPKSIQVPFIIPEGEDSYNSNYDKGGYVIANITPGKDRIFMTKNDHRGGIGTTKNVEEAMRFHCREEAIERFYSYSHQLGWSENSQSVVVCKLSRVVLDITPLQEIELDIAEHVFERANYRLTNWERRFLQLALEEGGKKFHPPEEKETE